MITSYLKNLLTLVVSLFLVYTTSCSTDEDDADSEDLKKSTLLSACLNSNYKIEYNYDDKNNLIRIIDRDLIYVSDTDSTDIAYDEEGRIIQTIYSWNNGEYREKSISTYIYSGDSIFVQNDSDTDIDTLIVVNNLLKEKRDRDYVITYDYDANGNLIESDEMHRNFTYNLRLTYIYDNSEKGLMFDANIPYWFVVACDMFNINYSQNLCVGNSYYIIKMENDIENESYKHYTILYEYENEKPIKMIEKNIDTNDVYEYTFEYNT